MGGSSKVTQVAMTEVSLTPYPQLMTNPASCYGNGRIQWERWGKKKVPTFLTGRQKERLRSGLIDGRIVTVIMKTASEGPGACWEHVWAVSGVCILWRFFFLFF